MKKFVVYLTILALAFSLGCSNDFDLVDDWKSIPVVYGILNQQDTAHYIKVEKAFLDESTSALVLAQEVDSLYFQNIAVNLIEKTTANNQTALFPLTLVDAALEGYPKAEGIFANQPNYAYKTTGALDPSKIYEIEINFDDSDAKVSGETKMIDDFTVYAPSSLSTSTPRLKFETGNETKIEWQVAENAEFYDLVLSINYDEYRNDNPGVAEAKSLEWVLRRSVVAETGNSQEIKLAGESLFSVLASGMEASNLYCRKLRNFTLYIYTGNEELYNYTNVGLANQGITGSVPLPVYTNLSEGRGVLASRYTKIVDEIVPDPVTYDELTSNALTTPLNFVLPTETCN